MGMPNGAVLSTAPPRFGRKTRKTERSFLNTLSRSERRRANRLRRLRKALFSALAQAGEPAQLKLDDLTADASDARLAALMGDIDTLIKRLLAVRTRQYERAAITSVRPRALAELSLDASVYDAAADAIREGNFKDAFISVSGAASGMPALQRMNMARHALSALKRNDEFGKAAYEMIKEQFGEEAARHPLKFLAYQAADSARDTIGSALEQGYSAGQTLYHSLMGDQLALAGNTGYDQKVDTLDAMALASGEGQGSYHTAGKGFTLIELLTVVGITTLLMAMLLPALGKAREASRRAVCASNLSQIGKAVVMYTNDHDGFVPPNTPAGFGDYTGGSTNRIRVGADMPAGLGNLVDPYLSDNVRVFGCPSANVYTPETIKLQWDSDGNVDSNVLYRETDLDAKAQLDLNPNVIALLLEYNNITDGTHTHDWRFVNIGFSDGHVKGVENNKETDPAQGQRFTHNGLASSKDNLWANGDEQALK